MLIIAAKSGQLGNRLLLFAHFIAFGIEYDLQVFNPAFDEYAHLFSSTAQNFLCVYPPPLVKIKNNRFVSSKYYNFTRFLVQKGWFEIIDITREKPFNWSDSPIAEKVQGNAPIFFQGWLFRDGWFIQDLPRLEKYAEPIRAYFQPVKKHQDNVLALIDKLKKDGDRIIGVHIRQGDYEQHQRGKYFYTTTQYAQIMLAVQQLFPHQRVKFLICSNAPQDESLFSGLNYVLGNNNLVEDMYALAECDYIIGAPSSYTMWASFYGNKPLYKIRDINRVPKLEDFVNFTEWQGVFNYRENWAESFWEWTA
jgi:hypothetical protein